MVGVEFESKLSRRIPKPEALLFPTPTPARSTSYGWAWTSRESKVRFKLDIGGAVVIGNASSSWSRSAKIREGLLAAPEGGSDIAMLLVVYPESSKANGVPRKGARCAPNAKVAVHVGSA